MRPLAHSVAAVSGAVLLPVGAAALAVRPRWRIGVGERLGGVRPPTPGRIWVHAASVGEVAAARRLVERLERRGLPVFASTTSSDGRMRLRATLPAVPSALAPLDHPWCVERALGRVRPACLVLVETEIWPVWLAAARRRGIPIAVVSGRISDRSLRRYRLARPLLGRSFAALDAVGARSDEDAQRYRSLGVPPERILVTGDLKLDCAADGEPLAADLAAVLAGGAILVAGSTHPGEERAVLGVLSACERVGVAASLVLAPRRPSRGEPLAKELAESGQRVRLRSRLGASEPPLAPGEILLLDSLGELPAVYARATVAFVGGTLVPVGGHNVLEPVQAGSPVLFGPELAHVREPARILEEAGAGLRVENADRLVAEAVRLLASPADAAARAARGREALSRHQGSVERSVALVEAQIGRSRGRNPDLG